MALFSKRIIELIEDGHSWNDIIKDIINEHSGKHINLLNQNRTKAVLVDPESVVHVQAPFHTHQEFVSHIEIPLDLSSVNEQWNLSPRVLVWLFFIIKAFPERCIVYCFVILIGFGLVNESKKHQRSNHTCCVFFI